MTLVYRLQNPPLSETDVRTFFAQRGIEPYNHPEEIGGEPLVAILPERSKRSDRRKPNVAIVHEPLGWDNCNNLLYTGRTDYFRLFPDGEAYFLRSSVNVLYNPSRMVTWTNCYPLSPRMEELLGKK